MQAWHKFVRCEMEKISVFCGFKIGGRKGSKEKGIESFVKRVRNEMMGKYICRWVKPRSTYMQVVKKIHELKFDSCWSEQICYYICKVSKSVKTLWPSSINNYLFKIFCFVCGSFIPGDYLKTKPFYPLMSTSLWLRSDNITHQSILMLRTGN